MFSQDPDPLTESNVAVLQFNPLSFPTLIIISLFYSGTVPTDNIWGPPSISVNCPRFFPRGVKWPERDVNHSFPFSAKVKGEWSYNSTPSICIHGVDMDKFIFTFTY